LHSGNRLVRLIGKSWLILEADMNSRNKYILAIFLLIPLIFLYSSCSILPPKFPDSRHVKTQKDMELLLNNLVTDKNPPGISMCVVKDNRIIYKKAFGYADGYGKVVATPDTIYHWWSITKPFTAVAILQLQEQGKLNVDDHVENHLPFLKLHPFVETDRKITLKDLLTHSSGLPNTGPEILSWVHFEGDPHPAQTTLLKEKISDYADLEYSPGSAAIYSNIGYMLLASVIESVSGLPYEDYIRKHILLPLKMDNTDFIYTEKMTKNEAIGSHPFDLMSFVAFFYLDKEKSISEYKNGRYLFNRIYTDQTGPSGLIGSVTDYCRFMMAILNKGELEGNRILSAESIQLMATPVIEPEDTPIGQIEGVKFSLGWFYIPEPGGDSLNHGGSGAAFVTMSKLYPDKKLGIAVMANGTYLGRRMGYDVVEMAARIKW